MVNQETMRCEQIAAIKPMNITRTSCESAGVPHVSRRHEILLTPPTSRARNKRGATRLGVEAGDFSPLNK